MVANHGVAGSFGFPQNAKMKKFRCLISIQPDSKIYDQLPTLVYSKGVFTFE